MLAHRQRHRPNIETTQGQCHVFAGGGGAHGANHSVTIRPDEGVTDLIVCMYTPTPNPPPPTATCYSSHLLCKAVSAHL